MKEKVGGASFPVVFNDGEHESNVGSIPVGPSMDFKQFQSMLSKMIGISPHQFAVYRVPSKDAGLLPEIRWRSPITAKSNFGALARDKDCYVLVYLKRSRKERRRKNSIDLYQDFYDPPPLYPRSQPAVRFEQQQQTVPEYNGQDFYDFPPLYPRSQQPAARFEQQKQIVPDNVVLLRRNPELANQQFDGYAVSPYCDPVATSEYLAEYKRRFRENYLMMMAANANWTANNHGYSIANEVVCEECRNAMMNGTPAEFHCCFYDPAVAHFKTAAGAISRPVKDSGRDLEKSPREKTWTPFSALRFGLFPGR